jgi:hypothetical protein
MVFYTRPTLNQQERRRHLEPGILRHWLFLHNLGDQGVESVYVPAARPPLVLYVEFSVAITHNSGTEYPSMT